jgi:hypothetical protein
MNNQGPKSVRADSYVNFTCVVIGSFSAIVVVAFAVWMAKHVLASYFDEKGKNLATKEDIAEITHKIEAVRLQYTYMVAPVCQALNR